MPSGGAEWGGEGFVSAPARAAGGIGVVCVCVRACVRACVCEQSNHNICWTKSMCRWTTGSYYM